MPHCPVVAPHVSSPPLTVPFPVRHCQTQPFLVCGLQRHIGPHPPIPTASHSFNVQITHSSASLRSNSRVCTCSRSCPASCLRFSAAACVVMHLSTTHTHTHTELPHTAKGSAQPQSLPGVTKVSLECPSPECPRPSPESPCSAQLQSLPGVPNPRVSPGVPNPRLSLPREGGDVRSKIICSYVF